jgi:peptide/nickel transport system permease protein
VTDLTDAPPQRLAVASQRQLIWWAFRKHRLAMAGLIVAAILYVVAAVPGFFAINDPSQQNARTPFHPPEAIHIWKDGSLAAPHFIPSKLKRDPDTLAAVYVPEPEKLVRLVLFGHGYSYRLFGLIETDRHLFASPDPRQPFFPFGTDRLGRTVCRRRFRGPRKTVSNRKSCRTNALIIGHGMCGDAFYYAGPSN